MNTKWLIPVAIAILGIYLYKKNKNRDITPLINALWSTVSLTQLNNLILEMTNYPELTSSERTILNIEYEKIVKERGWM